MSGVRQMAMMSSARNIQGSSAAQPAPAPTVAECAQLQEEKFFDLTALISKADAAMPLNTQPALSSSSEHTRQHYKLIESVTKYNFENRAL